MLMMALLQDADLTQGLECDPGCHVAIRATWQWDSGDPHTGAALSIQLHSQSAASWRLTLRTWQLSPGQGKPSRTAWEMKWEVPWVASPTQVLHKEAYSGFSPWPLDSGTRALLWNPAYNCILIETARREAHAKDKIGIHLLIAGRPFYFIIHDLFFKVCLSTLLHSHPQRSVIWPE